MSLTLRVGEPSNSQRNRRSIATRRVVAYDLRGAPVAYGWRQESELYIEVPHVATFCLPTGDAVVTAIPDERIGSAEVRDAYYGAALPLVLQATSELEVLHASAVHVPAQDHVAAFCGVSGSGKSTLAYALAARGFGHWGDDAVAFRVDRAQPVTAVGLPFTAKLREGSAAYFGASTGPSEVIEDFESSTARLAAVFLLEPIDSEDAGAHVVIERVSPGEALHALLPNAYRFQPQTDERRLETMRSYLEVAASVPIFGTRFPRRVERLPDLLDELEERISTLA